MSSRLLVELLQGVALSRGATGPRTVFLRAGTFYLPSTIQLGVQDSGLTIAAYNGEEVRIDGSFSLNCPTFSNCYV